MKEYLLLLVGCLLVNNYVMSQFLGICPFMGVSKKMDTAVGMGGHGAKVGVFVHEVQALAGDVVQAV